jgi:transcriptional regulator with XRE-family HTH domain
MVSVPRTDEERKILKILGDNIRRIRRTTHRDQLDFAFECRIHQSTFCRMEYGQVNVRFTKIIEIAKRFNIDITEFTKGIL